MDVNADDVHICLCKILDFSLKTCATICTKHPYASFSFLSLFLVYISFPSVFWALIYSIPVVVCSFIILNIPRNGKNKNTQEEEKEEESDGNSKFASDDSSEPNKTKKNKSYKRVHSVRRRRAKNFITEETNNKVEDKETNNKVEDKNAIASTNSNYDEMVDKNALTQEEEIPKEIHEVQVDYTLPKTLFDNHNPINIQETLKREAKDTEKVEDNKEQEKEEEEDDNDQKNVIDIDVSATKRLESLIARRRSRKLLSLQVRRTLVNMDINDRPPQIGPIVIPRNNSGMNLNGLSPGPGSAPSVLVPMRNPFDLPYDPQEEKPDLTGDSFDQEFLTPNTNRDMVFCRHESFSLGPFLPGEYYQNRDVFNHDFGFRQRNSSSSTGFHPPFSNPGNGFEKKFTFTPIMEQESCDISESKSNIDSPDDDDHIKEVIQVYENGMHSHSEEGEDEKDTNANEVEEEDETRLVTEDNPSTSSSSPSSSDEDVQVFKIDKETILKSMTSMARRNPVQESNAPIEEQLMMNYDTCSYDHNSNGGLNDQFYYDDDHKHMRRHTNSFSIASDLQVEVSEVSSPPQTIDENLTFGDDQYTSSYDGDTEKKITNWDDHDLWPSSSPNIQES